MPPSLSRRSFLALAGGAGIATALPHGPVAAGPGGTRTVQYRLRAGASQHEIAGRTVETWTYNGSLPGPLLRARVGDRVVVDFVNDLGVPTTIHWHGVEVPATQDGSSISQLPIEPGGSQRYEFTALRPSLFWYHPHFDTNEQVERGLHGALLIEDPDEHRMLGVEPAHEHVLVLDDILLDDTGIAPPFPSDPLANAVMHFNGREGNVLLVNGVARPTISVRNGTPQRLRVVNVANTRLMRLSFGDGQRVWRVGGDAGLLDSPVPVTPIDMVMPGHGGHGGEGGDGMVSDPDLGAGVMLTPGERADLVWVPSGGNGDRVQLTWHDWPRGDHGAEYAPDGSIRITHDPTDGAAPPEVLADFRLLGQPSPSASTYQPPGQLRRVEPIVASGDPIALTMGHGQPDAAGDVVFFLQRGPQGPLPFPLLTPGDVATVKPGDARVIEVTNLTMGAHNFHLHGFFFQLLETEFVDLDTPENNRVVPADRLETKDTILIEPRPGAPMRSRTITRLAASFDDRGRTGEIEAFGKQPGLGRSGGWLMHCHLLEHSASGMMSFVQVIDD